MIGLGLTTNANNDAQSIEPPHTLDTSKRCDFLLVSHGWSVIRANFWVAPRVSKQRSDAPNRISGASANVHICVVEFVKHGFSKARAGRGPP